VPDLGQIDIHGELISFTPWMARVKVPPGEIGQSGLVFFQLGNLTGETEYEFLSQRRCRGGGRILSLRLRSKRLLQEMSLPPADPSLPHDPAAMVDALVHSPEWDGDEPEFFHLLEELYDLWPGDVRLRTLLRRQLRRQRVRKLRRRLMVVGLPILLGLGAVGGGLGYHFHTSLRDRGEIDSDIAHLGGSPELADLVWLDGRLRAYLERHPSDAEIAGEAVEVRARIRAIEAAAAPVGGGETASTPR
jgi:hypothetical protein